MEFPVEQSSPTIAVVICSKDRPRSLRVCLEHLAAQTRTPDLTLVVDSSATSEDWHARGPQGFSSPYRFLKSSPGLTHQRNVALRALADSYDLVAFLDDDAFAEPGYVEAVIEAFAAKPTAVGIVGSITNASVHAHNRLNVLAGLDGPAGHVRRTGMNILAFPEDHPYPVQWLSGCCMSYRTSSIRGLDFDECRNGNGLGEDIDFSLRAGSRGPLWFWPAARIRHEESPINRDDLATVARRRVVHRGKLADQGIGAVTKPRVYASVVIRCGRTPYLALKLRSSRPLAEAAGELVGLKDVLVARRHRMPQMYV